MVRLWDESQGARHYVNAEHEVFVSAQYRNYGHSNAAEMLRAWLGVARHSSGELRIEAIAQAQELARMMIAGGY